KGAFTGAHAQRKKRFEQANEGTLFLDEIGDMPAELQTRLLRVLADGEFYRVGGHTPVKVDVRIIAATHQDLQQHVKDHLFREDLYHRLNVINIHSPALRERAEDIPLLLNHFLKQSSQELGVDLKTCDDEAVKHLQKQRWSGNIRQLENTARWLTVMVASKEISKEDLPPEISESSDNTSQGEASSWEQSLSEYATQQLNNGVTRLLDDTTPMYESILIKAALKKTGGKKNEAATLLGLGRNTLSRKITELNILEKE
ncbi:MAG TPA: nitrogen regulation protein NR(I), partial [Thiothrix sp.]|nr:nitrogen regulation protein NR(I) [Thiothrix sp.]